MNMDFELHLHGSIAILNAVSEDAQAWMEEHMPEDVMTWGINGYVIEPRYLPPILEGISEAGMEVE